MTFSLGSMVRLIGLMILSSTMLAIGIARLNPQQPDRRFARAVADYQIDDFDFNAKLHKQRWLNSDTGVVRALGLQSEDVFEASSCSPWTDEAGRRQVVGRWSNRTGAGPEAVCHSFGLSRRWFPDGVTIDQVATDVVPTGPPCWLPGTQARVVFAAGDGRLYRLDFEPATSGETTPRGPGDAQPQALTWDCARPGTGEVFICQVTRPEEPRLGGRLLATVRLRVPDQDGHCRMTRMQLWWLELDHAATRIVALGPLIMHGGEGPTTNEGDERSATLATLPDGSLGLAYVRQVEGDATWAARLVRLELDGDHRPIPAAETAARTVTPCCHARPLTFSTDGRWLNVLVGTDVSEALIVRYPTSETH